MAAAMSGFNAAYAASAGQHYAESENHKDMSACYDEDKKYLCNPNLLMFYPTYGTFGFVYLHFLFCRISLSTFAFP